MDLFLDTTILIDRTFGDKDVRDKIMSNLKGNRVTASSFAIGEIKSNILQQCCDLYNMFPETTNIFEAILKCANNVWKPAWYNRIIKICMYLGDCKVYTHSDLLNYKLNLKMLIEQFDDMVLADIEILKGENLVNCLKESASPNINTATGKFDLNVKSICENQSNVNCNIRQFITNNITQFNKIKDTHKDLVKSQNTNVKKLIPLKKPHGKNCWDSGDSILCTELPQDSLMYSTDKVIKNITNLLEKRSFENKQIIAEEKSSS